MEEHIMFVTSVTFAITVMFIFKSMTDTTAMLEEQRKMRSDSYEREMRNLREGSMVITGGSNGLNVRYEVV